MAEHSPVVYSCTGTWFCRLSLLSLCWRPVRTQRGRGAGLFPFWSASEDPRPGNCPAGWARPAPPGSPRTLRKGGEAEKKRCDIITSPSHTLLMVQTNKQVVFFFTILSKHKQILYKKHYYKIRITTVHSDLPSNMARCMASLALFGTLSITSRPSLISPLPSSQQDSSSCGRMKKNTPKFDSSWKKILNMYIKTNTM